MFGANSLCTQDHLMNLIFEAFSSMGLQQDFQAF
jgi:hypothetical protein